MSFRPLTEEDQLPSKGLAWVATPFPWYGPRAKGQTLIGEPTVAAGPEPIRSAEQVLRDYGVQLDSYAPGRHYALCPECSHRRSTAEHRKAKVLGVTIDHDGVTGGCNHCKWTFGGKLNGKGNSRDRELPSHVYAKDGVPYARKVRNAPGRAPKCWWEYPDGEGGWVSPKKAKERGLELELPSREDRQRLYRIDEVDEAVSQGRRVAVVEGEGDADTLWAFGIPATCSPDGASEPNKKPKWTEAHSEQLRGADTVVFNDNDPPGYAHADVTCRLSLGVAKSVRRLDLKPHWPEIGKGEDVSDWLAKGGGSREKLDALIAEAPDYTGEASAQHAPLPYIDMSTWDLFPAPPREWAVDDLIPMHQAHLTSGHGAIGKSLLELMRAVSHVLGLPWLGFNVRRGPVIYLSAEEEDDELRRRLEAITKHYGVRFKDLLGALHLVSYAGDNCLLGAPDRNGIIHPTELFDRLLADALRLKPAAVMVDTLTDCYAGDENNRSQTTQFVKLLQGLAIKARCSAAILAHPSNVGLATGSGLSGSTGWHNKVRSRLYIRAPTTEKGEPIDSDLREIQFLKNNYAKQGDTLIIRWKDGVFVPEHKPGSFESAERDKSDEEQFLTLLAKYNGQEKPVSNKLTANNYAPKLFAAELGPVAISQKRYAAAMERLFESKAIHVQPYGPPSKNMFRIAIRGKL
jgi:RecA-family ATPase